jgi:homoserine O-acetyltransferase
MTSTAALTRDPAPAASLDDVESRLFTTKDFVLASGVVLPELTLAYETYGTLAPDGRNAVLIAHGFTSSHHFAGRYRAGGAPKGLQDADLGQWDKLIGPGKPIDTEKRFVVASNMLGSSYGSTSPASINPLTGKRYGPDFPRLTVRDIVTAQKAMLDALGVTHLVAVAGPSYGGFQSFQWAVTFPDFMDGVVPVVTAPKMIAGEASTHALITQLATDPNWHGGWYYDNGGVATVLTSMRVDTLKRYGIAAQLMETYPDPVARQAEIERQSRRWAGVFDANSMVALRRALETFDTQADFSRIRAKVLYVLSRTDQLFPPSLAPGVMAALTSAGIDARYVEIDSDHGHMASARDADKWAGELRAFMNRLT